MRLLDKLKPLLASVGPRSRRIWTGRDRAHVEHRSLRVEQTPVFVEALEAGAAKHDDVRWVEINHAVGRVIVCFETGRCDEKTALAIVEGAERAVGIDEQPFPEDRPAHPADLHSVARAEAQILAGAAGLGMGLLLRASPFRPSSTGVNTSALIALVQSVPKLREIVEDSLGPLPAEHLLRLVDPFANAVGQRTMSPLVDITARVLELRELYGRQALWEEREPELHQKPAKAPPDGAHPRPRSMPPGPIETYAESAWMVSLSSFFVSLIASRSPRNATASLLAGLPKSARLGREAFASFLGRVLAERGVLVLDPQVLRRLDRVDTLVVPRSLLAENSGDPRASFRLGAITALDATSEEEARRVAESLFDRDHPVDTHARAGWMLGPLAGSEGALVPALQQRADALTKDGALLLRLADQGRVVALVEVRIASFVGVEELITSAREAQMRVLVATDDDSLAPVEIGDGVVPGGPKLAGAIRRLQQEGRVVCLVASGQTPALAAADCAVALCPEGETPPWTAHLLCQEDISDARFVLAACVAARKVARQSVSVAVAAASLASFVSAGGFLPNARRVMRVVNGASMVSMANGVRISYELSQKPLPAPRDPTPWHALDVTGALARMRATPDGLGRREIKARARTVLPPVPPAVRLIEAVADELNNPLTPLLAAGAGLSAVVGSVDDAALVAGVVVLNALVGGVQKFHTERAVAKLEESERRTARTRRAGGLSDVDARALVRGDIVVLEAGDVVPADCRVIEAVSLEVDASSFTGESLPVPKSAAPSFSAQIADRSSMLYEGTTIAAGRATAMVVAVGDDTEARRGAAAAGDRAPPGGVEARLSKITSLTGPIAGAAGLGLVAIGMLRGRPMEEVVGAGVSMAVAAVPEGLPLLATAAQLAAAKRLSEHGALVKNPRALEALGRVDILCVDKTGTVTEGRLRLAVVSDGVVDGETDVLSEPLRHVLAAALRATPPGETADTTDEALLGGGIVAEVTSKLGAAGWKRSSELTFEARRRFHAVLGREASGARLAVKGAPEALLARSTKWARDGRELVMTDELREEATRAALRLAERGLRVLAVADRVLPPGSDAELVHTGEGDEARVDGLTLRGFVAFRDPPRETAPKLIADLRSAGVEVVMITGDHPATALAIARDLGIQREGSALTGAELDRLTDPEMDERVRRVRVFARTTPSQKARLVRSFQRLGRVVAMAGDGQNDVPAIRLADVGIALGERSTTAARAAADLVITDERIETLVRAVVEGRALWASVRDAVSILIGGNLGEIAFTLGAGLFDGRPPLNARQLLVVNLLTDVAPAMAVALRPPQGRTMEALASEGPDSSLGATLYRDIALRSVLTAAGAGGAWMVGRFTGTAKRARTIGMVALVGTQLGQTLTAGGRTGPVLWTCIGSSLVLMGIVQTPGVSQFFGCTPLGPIAWGTAIGATGLATAASVLIPKAVRVPFRVKVESSVSVVQAELLERATTLLK
jgi:cation-transporting ATPase I